ncbi:PAP2 family protein [Massilia glaciei]|uniref:PAP2 family protein n=1 Tax=Massilia glaciei TaxID=1524097 RepID=A0A2U2HIT3_9BURK|nr:PAP2 family protein [Massilia glaciei]
MLLLCLSPLVLIGLDAFTNIDLMLADAMFDPAGRAFPWRHTWLAERFGHDLLKLLFTGLGVLAIVLAVALEALAARKRWRPWWRLRMRVVALSAVLVPLAIGALKRASASHCPWDPRRYGGAESYVRLLDALPPGAQAGHCMPAGHASTALWMVSLCVVLLPHRPRAALSMAGAMLMPGIALGWLQQMRGAHFLTHTLWSVWIACAIASLLYALVVRREERGAVPLETAPRLRPCLPLKKRD